MSPRPPITPTKSDSGLTFPYDKHTVFASFGSLDFIDEHRIAQNLCRNDTALLRVHECAVPHTRLSVPSELHADGHQGLFFADPSTRLHNEVQHSHSEFK